MSGHYTKNILLSLLNIISIILRLYSYTFASVSTENRPVRIVQLVLVVLVLPPLLVCLTKRWVNHTLTCQITFSYI